MFYSKKALNPMDMDNLKAPGVKNESAELSPEQAFEKVKSLSKERNFKESVDAIIKLNVDPTKGDQMIRGTCVLPDGTGNEIKVCVFADSEFHEDLKEAGADSIGDSGTLEQIAAGNLNFDKIICTPEQVSELKKYARILGPKGLMPNTKSGTLVNADEIVEQVR